MEGSWATTRSATWISFGPREGRRWQGQTKPVSLRGSKSRSRGSGLRNGPAASKRPTRSKSPRFGAARTGASGLRSKRTGPRRCGCRRGLVGRRGEGWSLQWRCRRRRGFLRPSLADSLRRDGWFRRRVSPRVSLAFGRAGRSPRHRDAPIFICREILSRTRSRWSRSTRCHRSTTLPSAALQFSQ